MITVRKADGSLEPFEPKKLENSLRRAGAIDEEARSITKTLEAEIEDGATTESIYRKAFEMLRESPQPVAARYSLRRALFGLGPTGFPFEDYLARLFEHEGYKTKTRLVLRGKCATHEIDVLARKGDDCVVAEAKFHLQPGTKSDLQVALYSYARYLDLEHARVDEENTAVTRVVAITNTKFTSAAIEYADCVGLELIGWNHPKGNSLQEWIERTKLYPVTVLSSLSNEEKSSLLSQGAVLCRDVIDKEPLLSSAGIKKTKIQAVMEESARLCIVP